MEDTVFYAIPVDPHQFECGCDRLSAHVRKNTPTADRVVRRTEDARGHARDDLLLQTGRFAGAWIVLNGVEDAASGKEQMAGARVARARGPIDQWPYVTRLG